jgi:rfaE bifunctional protein kinase chain/domain
MNSARFKEITGRFANLKVAVVGDFCLDRYLEIDPARGEISIETGLPVHNVVRVRAQPGGSGTILNNLVALGIGEIHAVGFAGDDGEGYELKRCLQSTPGVETGHFIQTPLRATFTYTKPLLMHPGKPPEELNRLDRKNWTQTPLEIQDHFRKALDSLSNTVNTFIFLEQTDLPETGVITSRLLEAAHRIQCEKPGAVMLADSRRGLGHFPPLTFKMNAHELARLAALDRDPDLDAVKARAVELAKKNKQPVFVTLADRGIVGADARGCAFHRPSLPLRGEIDIVGAGDAVTANLTASLAAGASVDEAIELANAAASIVIHQLGTTGSASFDQIRQLIVSST